MLSGGGCLKAPLLLLLGSCMELFHVVSLLMQSQVCGRPAPIGPSGGGVATMSLFPGDQAD